ncbi:hypothetical protein D6C86_01518 [Aureobasidium pullulans]|uniref:RRM domain-containing protein n=1 Tax=Aureobasidium pullulans TaxID=5580 RepID=A0A4S9WJZ0_AURPU|nr:hypothetical protein D6C94_00031 [Aureobasidium pullulans]THZ45188.1 hypothetical protein D6C87_03062 [Aureobasidium pullulans]THZ65751.1 hypothetical protein D6C86_01518 [Aureobasidium pullulans]
MASSWLDRVVADHLGEALAWRNTKRNVKTEPGTEPKQHHQYTDNGSSLKVRVSIPSAVLQVLKVQGQILTLTDGVVSIQARVSSNTSQRFVNQHSAPMSSILNKSITVSSCDITATHLGPPASRVQLIVLGFAISPASLDLSDVSTVTPIHQFSAVRDFLQRLHQLSNPPAERAAPTPAPRPALVPTEENPDVEMSDGTAESAEKVNPMKRPRSSPTRSSSHRVVRPRIHEGDDDVMIQKGVNLQQPVQASANSVHHGDLLRNLLSRNRVPSTGRASASTAIEQALRLGTGMSEQMGPPPVPAAKTKNVQTQARSPSQSQSLSQDFQSQISMPEPAAPEPVISDTGSQGVPGEVASQKDADVNTSKLGLPNNTPTSAQPELVEVSQSSLPKGDLPPQSQPTQISSASVTTSSSHLLEDPSSSIQRPMHRAPPPLLIKYASRPIPENQRRILDKLTSWWPPRPGTTFPHPNIPIEIIQEMEEYAEQRAARKKAKAREKEIEEENGMTRERERERARESLAAAPLLTQTTQSSLLPWSSSPPEPGPSRHRMQTHRRSTNLQMPLPPDSSAEDPMQVDEPEEEIPSSPPSGSVSAGSDDPGADEPLETMPRLNPRQLPEYPLSSPEESSSGKDPELRPDNSQPTRVLQESTRIQIQERKYSPTPDEDVSKPEVQAEHSVSHDRPQAPVLIDTEDDMMVDEQLKINADNVSEDPPQVGVDKIMEDVLQVENDKIMKDQAQVNVGQSREDKPQVQVAASPQPHSRSESRQRRRRNWGLEESGFVETVEQRQARKREIWERFRQDQQNESAHETTPIPHIEQQIKGKVQKEPEVSAPVQEPEADQMEVDQQLIGSSNSADPTIAKRANIIEQWRQRSDQQEGLTEAGAPDALVVETNVSEPAIAETEPEPEPEPALSEPTVLVSVDDGPVIPASAGHGTAPSEHAAFDSVVSDVPDVGSAVQNMPRPESFSNDRMQLSHQSTESDLPPFRDSQVRNAELQPRTEQQRPLPLSRAPKPPTYKAQQEASPELRLHNRKGIAKGKFRERSRALWVGSLPAEINNKQVMEMFAEFNPVSVAAMNKSAFVNFSDVETACKALEFTNGSILQNKPVVCNFTAPYEYSDNSVTSPAVSHNPRLPARLPEHDLRPSSGTRHSRHDDAVLLSLTVEDLFHEFVKKRKFTGNRKAFENLCKKLLDSSTTIPLAQWDNYVVLQPAVYMPYVSERVTDGELFDDYDTYWKEHLQDTPPDLIPILTPARLEAAFNNVSAPQSPASRPSAPISPQTVSGASRPRPSPARPPPATPSPARPLPARPLPARRTPSSASALTPTPRKAPVAEDLRRSVVERSAQTMISRPQSTIPAASHEILDMPEPRRASVWLANTVSHKAGFKVVQSDLYGIYKETFKSCEEDSKHPDLNHLDHSLAALPSKECLRVLGDYFESPEYQEAYQNYRSLGTNAELDYQDIIDHPHEPLKDYPGNPAYDERVSWHGGDPVLAAFSVGSLHRFGAMNLRDPNDIFTVPKCSVDVDESLKNKDFEEFKNYNDTELHPVFRRKNFHKMDDYDYELLKPVLKLATDILGSFDALGFFAGLLKAKPFTGTPEEQHRLGKGLLWKFSPDVITSLDQAVDVITHLRDLGDYVDWDYNDDRSTNYGADMATWHMTNKPVRPHGRTNTIDKIHPSLDQPSADLRVRFHMASIMLHELAHAFENAYAPQQRIHEPFMNDGRVAELGHSLISHLFGSVIRINGRNPTHYGIPFGCHFHDWPNSDNHAAVMIARHSLAKAGVHTHTYYPLHMHHLLKVLKPQFWRDEVERFGGSYAMKPPKLLGVRYRYDHALWSGEGPVEMETEAALPPNSLRPDVKEGLFWRDGAAALGKSTEYYKDVIADWTIAMLPWEFEDSKGFKTKPRTWDLIDRFHPGQFTIMTEPPPLLNFPKYDPARSQYERRKYVRDLRKKKLKEKAQKIAERRKLDKAKKGPPKRKREYDKIYEAHKPSAPSPTDLGRYPRANPRPKDYDPDLEFPRVPCIGNQQESPPPYNNREKWAPKWKIDFGDGGAYPEIDYQQYPLGMDEYDDNDDSDSDSDGSPSPPFKTPILDY